MAQLGLPTIQPEVTDPKTGSGRYRVVIYNDDHTPVDRVLRILIAATGCDVDEAAVEVWEAEHYGQANVHFAEEGECQTVAATIGTIGVRTDVFPEWDE